MLPDGYIPDFTTAMHVGHLFNGIGFIEVKPRRVTSAYIDEWEARCATLRQIMMPIPCAFLLQEGWAYGESQPISWRINTEGEIATFPSIEHSWLAVLVGAIPEAKTYRFDLEH